MEPQTNPTEPTNPTPEAVPSSPAPVESTSASATEPTIPATPEPVPTPTAISQPPADAVVQTPAPEPVTAPVPAQPAPAFSSGIPPLPTPPTPAPTSHTGLIIALIAGLLVVGGGGGYYYWTLISTPPEPIALTQTTTNSTSTPQTGPIRLSLETAIGAMNTAIQAGDYDAFVRVTKPPEALPTKEEFTEQLELLKDILIVDLSKVTYIDAKQEGSEAGYYFTTSDPENPTNLTITLIKFVQEGGAWKINTMFSTDLDSTEDPRTAITSNPKLAFSTTPVGTSTISFRTYTDQTFKIQAEVPADWKETPDKSNSGGKTIASSTFSLFTGEKSITGAGFVIYPPLVSNSSATTTEQLRKDVAYADSRSGEKRVTREIKLGSETAFYTTATANCGKSCVEKNAPVIYITAVHKGKQYTTNFYYEKMTPENQAIVDRYIKSFKFLD